MNAGPFSFLPLPSKGFIKGRLEQLKAGHIVLETAEGVFPVKVEGETVPIGEEVVFRLLREEPGLIVLSPYHTENLTEALPFFKELFAQDEDLGRRLIKAAVQESLPLTREVMLTIKKGLIQAEQRWGVKVHPRAIAFLQAQKIPLTPQSLLGALYILFPSVQKVMWQKFGGSLKFNPVLEELIQSAQGDQQNTADDKNTDPTKKQSLEEVFRETITFLQRQADQEVTLPHFVFYYFPTADREARWEGRSFAAPDPNGGEEEGAGREQGYAFRLEYQSPSLGQIQVYGGNNKSGLNITVMAERSLLDGNLLTGFRSYLEDKGWPVRSVQFQEYREEGDFSFSPLRIDGWL